MFFSDVETPEAQDAYHQSVIKGLIEDGANISAELANEPSPAGPKADPYERLSRGVRRCIVLARHIAEHPLRPAEHPVETKPANPRAPENPNAPRATENPTESPVARQAPRAESARDDRPDPLDDPDLDLETLQGSIPEIIAKIRRDLDLTDEPAPDDLATNDQPATNRALENDIERLQRDVATLLTPRPIRDG